MLSSSAKAHSATLLTRSRNPGRRLPAATRRRGLSPEHRHVAGSVVLVAVLLLRARRKDTQSEPAVSIDGLLAHALDARRLPLTAGVWRREPSEQGSTHCGEGCRCVRRVGLLIGSRAWAVERSSLAPRSIGYASPERDDADHSDPGPAAPSKTDPLKLVLDFLYGAHRRSRRWKEEVL